ncbi:hypothetical protein [Brevundimonas naejangsanensis]|jgi:hypothetical protein|uniref:hypothetical protein n=1 Tax=Brevundimonas naejangsanensis TaxID=588932 RepID=UPI003D04224B
MDDLENWLRRAASGDGVSLDRLEEDVWSRVRAVQAQRATDRIRVAAVAVALVVGLANGGLGATFAQTTASEMSIFSVAATSPLVRLEVG